MSFRPRSRLTAISLALALPAVTAVIVAVTFTVAGRGNASQTPAAPVKPPSTASPVPTTAAPPDQAPSGQASSAQTPSAAAPAPARPVNTGSREARLNALRAEASALAGRQRSLVDDLRRLEVDRQIKATEVERADAALAAIDAGIVEATARIARAERDLTAARPAIRERIVRVYKLGRLGYTRLLLDLDDARTFRRTAHVVSLLAQQDRARLERYGRLLATLQAERTRLHTDRERAQEAQRERQRGEQALAQAVAAQRTQLTAVAERRELNAQLLAELTAARDRLSGSVQQLAASPSVAGPSPGGAAPAVPSPGAARFAWPVTGRLHSAFGRQASSRFGTVIARNGVEIEAAEGSAVQAVDAGTVAFADLFGGFGRVVILDHGRKTYSLYGHLSAAAVQRGEAVERGQVVGSSGMTPTGVPAVYFELRIDGKPVDPVQWLNRSGLKR